jgi:hypothetical protein
MTLGEGNRVGRLPGPAPRLDIDDLIFRVRALAQAHPFSPRAYRYVNDMVARERTSQPVSDLGIWAGHAVTAGYCLRCVEEDEAGRVIDRPPQFLPDDLDEAATRIAGLIRTEGAEPYLLSPEDRLVEALDRLIGGEVERRLGHWEGTIDEDSWREIEEYLAWWVVKGYALRVAERFTPAPEGSQA